MSENEHKDISKLIEKKQKECAEFSAVEKMSQLVSLLKLTNIKDDSICSRQLKNDGAFRCVECFKNINYVYCSECWGAVKEKHKNHHIEYIFSFKGVCDCGNKTNIDQNLFCPKHQNKRQYNNFKNKEENCLISNFKKINKELCEQIAKYILTMTKLNKTKDIPFKENIKNFVKFIGDFCFNNYNLYNVISELLLENYPVNCSHLCLYSYNNIFHLEEKEICCCSFIRLLMSVWPNDNYQLLLCLSQNYNLRKIIGLNFISLYDILIKNKITDFSFLNADFLCIEVKETSLTINGLFDGLFKCPDEITEYYIKPLFQILLEERGNNNIDINKKVESLKTVIDYFKSDFLNILNKEIANYFKKEEKFYKFYFKLIDMLASLHNINSIETNSKHVYKGDAFIKSLLHTELNLLDLFSSITTLLDFNDHNIIQNIFTYFDKKIYQKQYKLLKESEYSYHISLFRGFSIFLNRYCFFISKDHKINGEDIISGIKSVSQLMEHYEDCVELLLKELLKLFGFVTACGENLLNYKGEYMYFYETSYYYSYKFIYRDFCLMKYLLHYNEKYQNKSAFNVSFQQIIKNCSVENSYSKLNEIDFFANRSNENEEISVIDWVNNKDNQKCLIFNQRILNIILNIIRDNTCLIWNLGSSYKALHRRGIEDSLMDEIINNDEKGMKELTKELIINKAITKKNSASFRDILHGIFYPLRTVLDVEKLINEVTDTTISTNQKIKFSIKEDYLQFFDTDYIISPKKRSNVENYISDFMKNKVSVFNKYFYEVNKYEDKLAEETYENFYDNNLNYILDCLKLLLKNKKFSHLQQYMLSILFNYIDVFLELKYDSFIERKEKVKNELIKILSNNNLKDDYSRSYCDYILQKASNNKLNINNNNHNNLNSKNIYSIVKEKFKIKNQKINLPQNIMEIEEESDENKEKCIYCHQDIDEQDINNPCGCIGNFILDNYINNAYFQIIKKKFKEYINNNCNILNIDNLYDRPKERKSIRILSCNHLIHFSCYFSSFMKSEDNISLTKFNCPLCKKNGNTFIPQLNYLDDKNKDIYNLLASFDFSEILNYSKKIYFPYEKELKNHKIILGNSPIIILDSYNNKNYKKNKINKNPQNLFKACSHLIEGFIGIKCDLDKNINLESEEIKSTMSDILSYFFIQFRDFMDYFANSNKKKVLINNWKNLTLCIRLLIRSNIFGDEFCLNIYNLLLQLKNLNFYEVDLRKIIENDYCKFILAELLFLLCVFFNYSNIEGYEKYILLIFMPLNGFGYFLRKIYLDNSFSFIKNKTEKSFISQMNLNNLIKYLKEDKEATNNILSFLLKKIFIANCILKNDRIDNDDNSSIDDLLEKFNLSSLKNKNYIDILDELIILINNDSNPNFSIFKCNYSYNEIFSSLVNKYEKMINEEACSKYLNASLFGSCLEVKYCFIELPKLAIDFEYDCYKKPCEKCKSKGKYGLICLDCGKKISCLLEFQNDEKKKCPFEKHLIKCGGGTSAILNTKSCEVLFLYNNKISDTKIPIYLDKYGEQINHYKINEEYCLNDIQYQRALQIFNDLDFQ